MLRFARRLLVVLVALAVIGGSAPAFARAFQQAGSTAMADMPCHMSMHIAKHGDHHQPDPCKGNPSDCCAQMCGTAAGLPSQIAGASVPVLFTRVDYSAVRSQMTGVPSAPEPLPPRTS